MTHPMLRPWDELPEAIKKVDNEFPKTIIESILIGLPIILNKNPSSELKEFKKLEILWAEDSSDSYLKIMKNFLKNNYNTKKITQKNLFKLQEIINAR